MAHNDGTLAPQLGAGGEPLPLVSPHGDPSLDVLTDTDLTGAETGAILVKQSDGFWKPNNILNQGGERQILVQQSDTPLDFAWETLYENRILPMAQVCVDYPYTKLSETSVEFVGIDLTYTFKAGRTFSIQTGVTLSIGVVDTAVYSAGDTTLTMTMSSGSIPAVMDRMCALGSSSSWITVDQEAAGGANLNTVKVKTHLGVTTWLVGTSDGKVLRSVDGGNTWVSHETFTASAITALHWNDFHNCWYLGSDTGEIRYSLSDGQTWIATVNQPTLPAPVISIAGGDFGSSNAGNYTYFTQDSPTNPAYAVQYADTLTFANAIAVIGASTYPNYLNYNELSAEIEILFRSNSGTYKDTLGRISNSTSFSQIDSTFFTPTTLYGKKFTFMYNHGRLFISNDNAGNDGLWSTATATGAVSDLTLRDPLFSGALMNGLAYSELTRVAVVVGDNGNLSYSPDYGVTWYNVANGFGTEDINDIAFSDQDGKFIAVSDGGLIATSLTGLI